MPKVGDTGKPCKNCGEPTRYEQINTNAIFTKDGAQVPEYVKPSFGWVCENGHRTAA